jgi:hypothetical protein
MPATFAPIAALLNDFTSKSLPLRGTDITVVVIPPRVPCTAVGGNLSPFPPIPRRAFLVPVRCFLLTGQLNEVNVSTRAEGVHSGGREQCRTPCCQRAVAWLVPPPNRPDTLHAGSAARPRPNIPVPAPWGAWACRNAHNKCFSSCKLHEFARSAALLAVSGHSGSGFADGRRVEIPAYFLLLITRQSGRSCFLAHRGNVEQISIWPRCQFADSTRRLIIQIDGWRDNVQTLPNNSGSLAIFAAIRRALVAEKHDLDQRRRAVVVNDIS